MKKTFLTLALPLLLAFSPASVFAARTLWVSVDGGALVVDEASGTQTAVSKFQSSGRVLNAAKVSVSDASGGSSSYLLMVYEDPDTGGMVADDPDAHTVELPFGQDSGSGSSGSSGSGSGGTSSWFAFCLPGNYDEGSGDLTVTLELGNVDWDAVADAYEVDPSAPLNITFERLAFATSTIGDLQTANHISPLGTTAPPGSTPWSPTQYTAVPEPGTVGTALLGVFLLTKRRKTGRQRG